MTGGKGYERRKRINGRKAERQREAIDRREPWDTFDDERAQFANDVAADAREAWGQA